MKKVVILFLSFSFFLALTALCCPRAIASGEQEEPGEGAFADDPEEESRSEPEKEDEAAPGETEEKKKVTEKKWNIFLGALFGGIFEGTGKAIYDVVLRDHGFRYRAYPYSKDKYAFYDPDLQLRGAPGVLKAECQRMNSRFYGFTWRLMLRLGSGFDLSVVDTLYDEKRAFDKHDRMKYTRLRLSYLRSPASGNILIRSGTGIVTVGGRSGLDVGFEIDCFPYKPIAFHAGFSQIFIANHKGVTEYDFALGLMAGAFEFALGYRGVVMKREDINGIYLSVGFWF